MHTKDLPKANTINQDKGMLLYCEDGVTLKQISVKLFGGGSHTTTYSNLFTNDFEYSYANEQTMTTLIVTITEAVGYDVDFFTPPT